MWWITFAIIGSHVNLQYVVSSNKFSIYFEFSKQAISMYIYLLAWKGICVIQGLVYRHIVNLMPMWNNAFSPFHIKCVPMDWIYGIHHYQILASIIVCMGWLILKDKHCIAQDLQVLIIHNELLMNAPHDEEVFDVQSQIQDILDVNKMWNYDNRGTTFTKGLVVLWISLLVSFWGMNLQEKKIELKIVRIHVGIA